MRRVFVITCGLVLVLILALSLHNSNNTAASSTQSHSHSSRFRGAHKDKHRIAIVIPFYGETVEAIPPYFNLFLTSAAGSAKLVDFLLVHNGVLDVYPKQLVPPNVHLISTGSTKAFIQLLLRVMNDKKDLKVGSRDELIKIVSYHIHQYPYVLVEFKPATGHIFASLLEGYSHWGYADLDIVFGDLPRWITKEELEDYDIVTYGYGDQERLYLRGQFTIHKNDPKVNQLWRECSYLSSMDQRFANVIAKKEKLRVESAEGCYSSAILKRNDIKVKYAVKAFTDIDVHDSIHTHGLYQGIGSKRDRSVIYKAQGDEKALLELSPTWFEDSDNPYGQKKPLQIQVGTKQLLQRSNATKPKCMYWVPEHYQHDICISGVTVNETVYWIHGQLYKQPFENVKLPGNIQTQPFFHFQEWKRYYRSNQLASVHHSTHAQGWVLVKEGAIPLLPQHDSRSWTAAALHHVGQHNNNNKWKTPIDRKLLPHARYCLRAGRRQHPPSPVVATCFQSISWRNVEIVLEAPVWKHVDVKREVTLALTVQITQAANNDEALNGILDVAIANVEAWQGQPCVLVIYVAGATPQSVLHVKNRFAALDTDATLVALIASKESHQVSRKALFNMASDAAPTRWVVSGVEVERGMVLSKEASSVAYRRSKLHGDGSTGTVLIVPQFAIQDDKDDRIHLSFTDLAKMWRTGTPVLNNPDEYDPHCKNDKTQDKKNEVFRAVHKLWWRLSTKETAADYVPSSEASFRELALMLDDMQLSFAKLLTTENEKELKSLDVSPILMVDSIGPNKGMKTSELAREVEEFGGKQCYNGLRLAQLAALGYNFDVLTSAFAISTSGSRQAAFGHAESDDEDAAGSSRCDGCFMFGSDDDKGKTILQYIATDERVRPAKASILWDKIKSSPSYTR